MTGDALVAAVDGGGAVVRQRHVLRVLPGAAGVAHHLTRPVHLRSAGMPRQRVQVWCTLSRALDAAHGLQDKLCTAAHSEGMRAVQQRTPRRGEVTSPTSAGCAHHHEQLVDVVPLEYDVLLGHVHVNARHCQQGVNEFLLAACKQVCAAQLARVQVP